MFKRLIILTMIIGLIFGAGSEMTSAEDTETLRLGMMEAEHQPIGEAVAMFAENVEEYTDGAYEVDVFYGAALGETADVMEDVMDGHVAMYVGGISWLENFVDDYRIFSMNWAFDDNEHLARFFETERYEEMKEDLEELDVVTIEEGFYRNPRNVLSTEPIRELEDFEGLVMRTPPQEMYVRSWEAVGANPTQMDYGEVYMGLQQGVIDAMENPIESIYGQGFQEVAGHITFTQHLLNPYSLEVSQVIWEDMDEEYQNAIKQAAEEAAEYYSDMIEEEEAKLIEEMEEDYGTEFHEIDIDLLAEQVVPLAEELEEQGHWSEGLFEYARELAD